MLNDDALAQIAYVAERRSRTAWERLHDALTFDTGPIFQTAHPVAEELKSPVALALLFWGMTYILFTVRAFTISADADVLSGIRFTTTGVGAALVGVFLAQINERTVGRNAAVFRILAATVGASLVVWTARNLYAAVAPEPFTSVLDNGRWAMFWAGYCTSFLALYLLYLARRRPALLGQERVVKPFPSATAREAALSWLVDALADELRNDRKDAVFLDGLKRELRVPAWEPRRKAREDMNRAASEIIDRLRHKYSEPGAQDSTRRRRIIH